ncbi:MAG TPA: ribonuclease P protein component [Gammaproteobacteria bacterium]|nr:ribonuclease P protein component [Gammaproteobacteria bacterium]
MIDRCNNCFPRKVRLTQPAQFHAVFKQGRRVGNHFFSLVTANTSAGDARLGLAVSRKVAARAVARNRLKRLARETFRAQRQSLPAVDIVLMARRAATTASQKELRHALSTLFARL